VQLYQPRGFWARRKCDKFTAPATPRVASCDFINMAIKQDDIEKVAELARIRIADEEIGQVTRRITEILHMVDRLQTVDTRDVEPMANPLDAVQYLRPDVVTEANRRASFQAIAPAVENGLYLVPRVIE
jgi:aspartyl-tRNA(Asn)/glutamyl-tRNA(Gln) amidotransferase subunit C